MPSYVYLQHYTSQGDLGISRDVFVTLGEHVVTYVKNNLKSDNISISDEVEVTIKTNKVYYRFFINKKGNGSIKKIEQLITNYVNSNLMMICDIVPFEISLKILNEESESEN